MARTGITFEQVAAVADALAGEGHQPSIRAVREKLGDTGSPNTIHKHLTAWREARPAATVAAAPELPKALATAIAVEIERDAAAARGEIEGRLVQTQAEAAELAAAGDALETEREALAELVVALTSERDTLAGKAEQQAADLADAQQRIEREQQAAEAARVELATARVRAEQQVKSEATQAAELERLRAALAEAQQCRTAAEQQAAVLAARLDAAADRATHSDARIEKLEQEALKALKAHEDARTAAATAATAAATAAAQELRAAQAQAQAAGQEAARLAGHLEALKQAQEQSRGKGKTTHPPVQKSFEVD